MLGRRDSGINRVIGHWPFNLSETTNSRVSERPCLEKRQRNDWGRQCDINLWPLHIPANMCVCMHAHARATYTHTRTHPSDGILTAWDAFRDPLMDQDSMKRPFHYSFKQNNNNKRQTHKKFIEQKSFCTERSSTGLFWLSAEGAQASREWVPLSPEECCVKITPPGISTPGESHDSDSLHWGRLLEIKCTLMPHDCEYFAWKNLSRSDKAKWGHASTL